MTDSRANPKQYDPKMLRVDGEGTWDGVLDYRGVDEVVCFDPAYPPYSKSLSGRFVFATIACYPASKRLRNGVNAHITLREPEWWRTKLDEAAARHGGITLEAWVQARAPNGTKIPETRLGN